MLKRSARRRRELGRNRVARHAARAAAGKAVAREVEYDAPVVNMLVRLGWLPPLPDDRPPDQRQVSEAITRLLADTAKNL